MQKGQNTLAASNLDVSKLIFVDYRKYWKTMELQLRAMLILRHE